ncbi:MAG: LemA family protein [Nocardioides sp.]
MTPSSAVALVAVALVVVLLVSLLVMYNRFVRQRVLIDESWGQTDVELTRRHELIPNLVSTVQGYAAHERSVLEALTTAREAAQAHRSDDPKARESYEDALGGAVSQVLVRAEAYPDLKASANFLQLQDELTNTEDRIAAARRFYNGNVRAYNTRVATFPSNLVASTFHFERRDFFELRDQAARQAPAVDLRPE